MSEQPRRPEADATPFENGVVLDFKKSHGKLSSFAEGRARALAYEALATQSSLEHVDEEALLIENISRVGAMFEWAREQARNEHQRAA